MPRDLVVAHRISVLDAMFGHLEVPYEVLEEEDVGNATCQIAGTNEVWR
jgi:hypothetical protein